MDKQSQASSQKSEWYKTWWGVILFIIFLPIALIWFVWAKTSWSNIGKVSATVGIVVVTLFASVVYPEPAAENQGALNVQETRNDTENSTLEDNTGLVDYSIVKDEDISIAGAVRYSLGVVVSSSTSEGDIKMIAQQIIEDRKAQEDFSALSIAFYDRAEDVDGAYTLALAEYAPNGNWSDADTVDAGDYSQHEVNYEFRSKALGENEEEPSDRPTAEEQALCDAFDAISEAENYASDEASRIQETAKQEGVLADEVDAAIFKCYLWENQ